MSVQTSLSAPGVWVVTPVGRIDARLSPILEETLQQLISGGSRWLVVDFSRVNFVASSGLKALIAARRKIRVTGGDVALVGLNPQVREVLEMTGIDRLFGLYATVAEAVAGIRET